MMISAKSIVQAMKLHSLGMLLLILVVTPGFVLAADEEEKKLPEPEKVTFTARDGAILHATFYASELGKEAVPVLLLHDLGEDRSVFEKLCLLLQENGHAALAVDLRGHGESNQIAGVEEKFSFREFRTPGPFIGMVQNDMEAAKAFLMQKNNSGELNIEKLTVIGSGMGATVALNWAASDWSFPPLVGVKQGQDVKALILLSPKFNVNGFTIADAMKMPAVQKQLSIQIIVGSRGGSKEMSDAKRIHNILKPFHRTPTDREQAIKHQDLWLETYNTSLQGSKMLASPRPLEFNKGKLEDRILGFIKLRLVNKEFPWTLRKKPLQ